MSLVSVLEGPPESRNQTPRKTAGTCFRAGGLLDSGGQTSIIADDSEDRSVPIVPRSEFETDPRAPNLGLFKKRRVLGGPSAY